jgi:transcriptional regulator with XRE-family HTH domain
MSVNIRQTPNHTWKQRSLGSAILQRRTELGLTQAALAERVATCGDWGFRQSDISRLERGIVTLPHFTRMRSLAAALELPVGELLAKSGWTGAEGAFPSADTRPTGRGHAEPDDTAARSEHLPSSPAGSSDEIQQLRQEIVRLRETVELLQKTLTSNGHALRGDGDAPRA